MEEAGFGRSGLPGVFVKIGSFKVYPDKGVPIPAKAEPQINCHDTHRSEECYNEDPVAQIPD